MDKVTEFRDEYAFLSNFYPAKVKWGGVVYPTVEHAYQAAKTPSHAMRVRIRMTATPGQVKRLGRRVILRPNWDVVKLTVMRLLLIRKFSDPVLRERLLATGDAVLEEGNRWGDTYWGICPPGSGHGQNKLGQLLMDVRNKIRVEQERHEPA